MSVFYGRALTAGGGSGISAPIIGKDFNWTGGDGTYQVLDDGDKNWRIKFLSSGTFTPLKGMVIDVFCVGAGGGGIYMTQAGRRFGTGGAGGYTKTGSGVVLPAGTSYAVEIGAGGSAYQNNTGSSTSNGGAGGRTSGFGISAGGGGGAYYNSSRYGGDGGSGGGSDYPEPGGAGGSDGSNGFGRRGGTGQGTTTREFGEESGDLYAGGGGGVYDVSTSTQGGLGGDGGGGIGNRSAGEANTGGGGGAGYAGGSGIVIIRKHKEAAA